MITFPRQPNKRSGWTLKYEFLCAIKDIYEKNNSQGVTLGIEEIEDILIAVEKFCADESN